jgi:hypothetical protein
MLIAGERQSRVIIAEHIKQYNTGRSHKGTDSTCAPPTTHPTQSPS